MYLGYSGQGKTTAMEMAMVQYRRVNGVNLCVRACHMSFRDSTVSQDEDKFVARFSEAIGGYNGMYAFAFMFKRLRFFTYSFVSFVPQRLINRQG